ncbi:MAG: DUF3293 domain-containing protein [Luteimonas sp.]
MGTDDGAGIAALLDAYLAADYRWELDNTWHALRIGEPARELDAAYPASRRFALLSAWNPQSVRRPDVLNRIEDQDLQRLLEASALPFRPAFAAAPNRSWREPSWVVVDLPVMQLDAFAGRFGQLGTLSWCRGEPCRLRMYADEPVRRADYTVHDCVDWVK